MRWRRSSTTAKDEPAASDVPTPAAGGTAVTPGKGRPTPKRSEAEKTRRQAVKTPKNKAEAKALARQERARSRQALVRGDDANLPPRDSGRNKKLARDIVDARRNVSSYLLFILLVTTAMQLMPIIALRALGLLGLPLVLIATGVDSMLLARKVRRTISERYGPDEVENCGSYAVLRAFQLRRLRLPPPKVDLGDSV